MSTRHRDIPEAELHEPKGVSTAAADQVYVTDGAGSGTFKDYDPAFSPFVAASADQVYVSDGAGSGTLQPYDKEPKGIDTATADQVYVADGAGSGSWTDLNNPFAPTFVSLTSQNDSTISLTAASDSTLKTNSDYVPLNNTGMWSTEASQNITAAASAGQFTIDNAGTYNVHVCCTLKLDVKGRIGLVIGDGTNFLTKRVIVDVNTTETTMVLSTVVSGVTASTTYGVYIASEGNATATVQTATFVAERMA